MKKVILIVIMLIGLILTVTYAFFSWQSSTNSNVTITAGVISITYNGGPNINNITLIPTSSKEKAETDGTGVAKTITASSTEDTYMDLNMSLDTFPNGLKDKSLVWQLYKNNTIIGTGNFADSEEGDIINLVMSEPITTTTATFKLYIWIDGTQDNPETMMNQDFEFNLSATATDNPNRVTVSFDANGGSVNLASKTVRYNEEYGSLPIPTKNGYTFKGWNGKNLICDLNQDNFIVYNHGNRTSSQFLTENNLYYIHFMGLNTETRVDSAWYIIDKEVIPLNSGIKYNLNFMVRSANNLPTNTYFPANTRYSGIYDSSLNSTFGGGSSSLALTYIERSMNFTNNGEWQYVNTTINVPSNVTEAKLVIGNDNPDLYGLNSYIDITNIQLEEGTDATAYEPHYITNNTTVVQESNHTLTAIWEENN